MVQKELWNKLKQRLKEVSIAAADFTEEQALIGKLKFEILTLKRKVDKLHLNLGVHMCEMSKLNPQPNPFEDADVIHFISEVEDLEMKIEAKRREITEVADHFRTKSTETNTTETNTDPVDTPPVTPPFEPPMEPVPATDPVVKSPETTETPAEKPIEKIEEVSEEAPKRKPRKPRKAVTKKKTDSDEKTTPKKPKGRPKKEKPAE
ncbi:MAG: hypothetical protein HN356_03715 [Calditrichaeota bacterium]|jgi:outer membrane biosynthesis protein TonB|nr:hypothetical protein [Calditrichota bacterium]